MGRRIQFTINNPTVMDMQLLLLIPQHDQFRYMIYQGEFSDEGTRHIQGYLEITANQRMSFFKKLIGMRAHIETANGSSDANIHYCKKPVMLAPNTPCMCKHCKKALAGMSRWLEPQEFGKPATDITASGFWESVLLMVTGGATDLEIIEKFPQAIANLAKIKDYRHFLKTQQRGNKLPIDVTRQRRDIRAVWIYGPSGSGKTRAVWDWCESTQTPLYTVGEIHGFDEYSQEKAVIWDDFSSNKISFKTLLRYLDTYPVQLECRFHNKWAWYNDFFITHIKSPRETYSKLPQEVFDQLKRRLHVVKLKYFSGQRIFHYNGISYDSLGTIINQIAYRQ